MCVLGDATKDRCQSNARGSKEGQMYVCVPVCWWYTNTFMTFISVPMKGVIQSSCGGILMDVFYSKPTKWSFLSSDAVLHPQESSKQLFVAAIYLSFMAVFHIFIRLYIHTKQNSHADNFNINFVQNFMQHLCLCVVPFRDEEFDPAARAHSEEG